MSRVVYVKKPIGIRDTLGLAIATTAAFASIIGLGIIILLYF